MLRLRPEQITALGRPRREAFVGRALGHLVATHPRVVGPLDDGARLAFVEEAVAKAGRRGMSTERDAIVVLDVMALLGRDFGRDFERDPALAHVHAPMTGGEVVPMHRADELWRRTRAHLTGTDGR